MGLFSSKKKTQAQLVSERLEAMKASEDMKLAAFCMSEIERENEIERKINKPPKYIWKKNRYKNRKRAELQELREAHDKLFSRDDMQMAERASAIVLEKVYQEKGNNEEVSISNIEGVFAGELTYDAENLVTEGKGLSVTDSLKKYIGDLKSCDLNYQQKPNWEDFDDKTKNTISASLLPILGIDVDFKNAIEFINDKHSGLQRLLYYRALLERIEQEVETMLRQPGANLDGLNKDEYAKLYGARLTADALWTQVMLKQGSLKNEYQQYQKDKKADRKSIIRNDDDDDFEIIDNTGEKHIKEQKGEHIEELNKEHIEELNKEHIEELNKEQEEYMEEENEELEEKSTYQTLNHKMLNANFDMMDIPEECKKAKRLQGIFDKLKHCLIVRSYNMVNIDLKTDWKAIKEKMYEEDLLVKMGPVSDITSFSLPLIEKPLFGADSLMETDELLFLEYAIKTVVEAFADAMDKEQNKTKVNIQSKVAEVKATASKLIQELKLDKVDKDHKARIKKAKEVFEEARKKGIEESWEKYPECFAYYQFMNDEVVKTNDFLENKRQKPGLFNKEDFFVFDSNDPQVLKEYLKTYKNKYMKQRKHNPMYDEIYEYLEKHVNYRIKTLDQLKKIAEKGPDASYKKNKKWDIDEENGKYLLTGYEITKQDTPQGCWSVAIAEMLQYRGIKVDQKEVRSHHFEIEEKKINYAYSYRQNMNGSMGIDNHANFIAEIAPDTMMKQFTYAYKPPKMALKKNIQDLTKKAIGKSHGPLVVLYGGHYRVIYGCEGENVFIHDPLYEKVDTWQLDDLLEKMWKGWPVSFYWLTDLPKANKEKERVLEVEVEGVDIHYNKNGVLEYNGTSEIDDAENFIAHKGYGKFFTGGDGMHTLEYTFLPAKEKRNISKKK